MSFCNFIPNYSTLTNNLISRTGKPKKFKLTEEMENEFNNIKQKIKNIKKIGFLNYEKELILRTGESNVKFSEVILQKNDSGILSPV